MRVGRRLALIVFGLAVGLLDLVAGAVLERLWPATLPAADPVSAYRAESPVYHHDLRPGVAATAAWGSHRYPMITSSLGFRDRVVRQIEPAAAGRRVLLIGDSVTEGVGVPYEQTFAGRIDAALAAQGVEVLNAAVVSYSPSIYERKVRFLVEERHLELDEVVVFLDISDIEDEALYYATDAEDRIVDAPGTPRNDAGTFDDSIPGRPWWAWTGSGRLLHQIKNRVYGSGGWLPPVGMDVSKALDDLARHDRADWTVDEAAFARFGARGLERARAAMDRLHQLLARRGIALTLVVYPWPAQVLAHDRDSKQVAYWRAWAAENGVRFVDLFPLLVNDGDPWPTIHANYLPWDVHFSAIGHARVTDAMLPVLAADARGDAVNGGPAVAP